MTETSPYPTFPYPASNHLPGTETQTAEASTPQTTRTFYRSDYGRMARLVQRMRHVQGDRYTPKPEAQQDEVSALALTLVQVFEADSDRFDAAEFMTSTELPVKPADEGSEPYPTQAYDDETYALNHPENDVSPLAREGNSPAGFAYND